MNAARVASARGSSSSWRRRPACDASAVYVRRARRRRERLALEELERRAAAGGHVAHRARRARPRATAAAESPPPTIVVAPSLVALGHRVGDRARARVERRRLEHAHRSVPEHRLRRRDGARVRLRRVAGRCRTSPRRRGSRRAPPRAPLGACSMRRRDHRVVRQDQARARRARAAPSPCSTRSGFDERLPRLEPIALKNVHAIAPPIEQRVDLRQQRLDDVDLARDLRAAEDRDERTLRVRRARRRGTRAPSPSAGRRRRAQRCCATPSVDACARCAAPNASFT